MQNKHYRTWFRTAFAFIIGLSTLHGSVTNIMAQTAFRADGSFRGESRDEAYANAFRQIRGQDFVDLLAGTMTSGEVEDVQMWLDRNNAQFFRAVDTAFQRESAIDAGRRLKISNVLPQKTPAISPTKRKTPPRRYGRSAGDIFELGNNDLLSSELLAIPLPSDDIVISKTETDDGIQMSGSVERSKVVGDVTITQGETANTRNVSVSGGNVGTEYNGTEFVEYTNRSARVSSRMETTVRSRVMLASCPDADGISSGYGTMTYAFKKTITTPQTIAVITRDLTTRMEIKGFVNDSAEFTHFDMKGGAAESTNGADRARKLGLLGNSNMKDGTKEVPYETLNNKLGTQVTDNTGFTRTVGEKLGDHRGTFSGGTNRIDAERIDQLAGRQVVCIYQNAVLMYKVAENHWQGGGCVEVIMSAPKTVLDPGEQIDIVAETKHKHEKIPINAELSGVARATVSPEKQNGTPKATFTLTAPPKGDHAMVIISSVSRRGLASEMINFDETKPKKPTKPPVKDPIKKCTGTWAGKITAVKTKRTNIVKPASGRLVRQIEDENESFSVDYSVLGIADTTQGFTNAYFSDAQMNFRSTEYRESNYAPGKMSCNKSIITTPQTMKIETLMTALSSKRITVYVTSRGDKGILTFDSPEVNAERIITRTYESACPSYNAVNSGVDRSNSLIEIPSPGFEIEFELGAKSDYVLEGSKTIDNSDGSQTVVTWNLKRGCT